MRKLLQELAECERMMKRAEEKPSTTPPTAQETPSGTTLPPPPSTPPAAAPPAEEQAAEGASKENIDKFNALYTAKGGVIPEVLDPSKAPKDQWYNDPRVQQKALWSTGIGLATALGGYALTGGRGGIAPWLLGGLGIGGGIGGMLGYKDWTDAAEQYKKNSEQWKAYDQALGEYERMLAEEREAATDNATAQIQEMAESDLQNYKEDENLRLGVKKVQAQTTGEQYMRAYQEFNDKYIHPVARDPNLTPQQRKTQMVILAAKRDEQLAPLLRKLREENARADGHYQTAEDAYYIAYNQLKENHPYLAKPAAWINWAGTGLDNFGRWVLGYDEPPIYYDGEYYDSDLLRQRLQRENKAR